MKRTGLFYFEALKSFSDEVAQLTKEITHHFRDSSSSPATMEELLAKLSSASTTVSAMISSDACTNDGGFSRKFLSKRRKIEAAEEMQVVKKMTDANGLLEDGYSWRKYGQKEILGSPYPRGYYRCSHRPTRGCSALKQVQQSGKNPNMWEITYKGAHTCNAEKVVWASSHGSVVSPVVKLENSEARKEEQSPFSFLTVAVDDNSFGGLEFEAGSRLQTPTTSGSNFLSPSPMGDELSDTLESLLATFSPDVFSAGVFSFGELEFDDGVINWLEKPEGR